MKMRVSVSAVVLLVSILMLSIFVAKVSNLIATDLGSARQVQSIVPKYHSIDDSPDHLMWFVQVSDLHISIFKDPSRITELKEFCDVTIIQAIRPPVVLASGDLTDAKTRDSMGSKQTLEEWRHYKSVLEQSGVTKKTTWLDVRGNHDNFNVMTLTSPDNFFLNYSVQGRKHARSYMHQIDQAHDKYSFIAIDACLELGPRRPFNFIGMLDEQDIKKVENLAEEAVKSGTDYIIWFGHYPTSSILTQYRENIRTVIGNVKITQIYG